MNASLNTLMPKTNARINRTRLLPAALLLAVTCTLPAGAVIARSAMAVPAIAAALPPQGAGAFSPVPPDKLATLLPSSVYFQGRTAPLQLRNAGAVALPGNGFVWASLVDTAGYASNVQERYQFYLVTETPLTVGGTTLAPGAYGGGFVGDRCILMDLGGHTVAEIATQSDQAMPRPRPLQLQPDGAGKVKLFLGRRWVTLTPQAR